MARRMFSEKQIDTMIDAKVNGAAIAPDKIVLSNIEDITDADENALIQVVTELPATPVTGVIYLIREA